MGNRETSLELPCVESDGTHGRLPQDTRVAHFERFLRRYRMITVNEAIADTGVTLVQTESRKL